MMGTKEAYKQKLQAKLTNLRAEVEKLKAKAGESSADAKIELNREMDELRAKQAAAKSKLDELGDSAESAWDELKAGVEKAFDDLGNGIKAANEKFRR